jgi:hypothetical protein
MRWLTLLGTGTALIMATTAEAAIESVGLYDVAKQPTKVILKVCNDKKHCDELFMDKKDMESEAVQQWFNEIIKKDLE